MSPRPDREVATARSKGDELVGGLNGASEPRDFTRFVWFWSFWAWSCESYRVGALLRSPLEGISSNWDGWFRHEASVSELRSIQLATGNESTQREFVEWLCGAWTGDLDPTGNRSLSRFVVTQLAHAAPFRFWPVFESFKEDYDAFGISAIILAQGSSARAEDVRQIEALALPDLENAGRTRICTENFRADDTDMAAARGAAQALFHVRSVLLMFASWMLAGRRPYVFWIKAILTTGWLTVAGLLFFLSHGPDPGHHLRVVAFVVVGLWFGLTMTALTMVACEALRFTNEARQWKTHLLRSHLWFRMPGGLTVKGGSAGLAFCLNAVQAIHRAFVHLPQRSWIWKESSPEFRRETHPAPPLESSPLTEG